MAYKKEKIVYRFLCSCILRLRLQFVLLLFLLILGLAISSIQPLLYGKIIDTVTSNNVTHFNLFLFTYFTAIILSNILHVTESYYGEWISFRISSKMKSILFKRIILLRFAVIQGMDKGKLLSRLNGDIETITTYIMSVITSIITICMNSVISLIFIFQISGSLAKIALLFIPLSFFANFYFKKRYRALQAKKSNFYDRYYTFQINTLNNIVSFRSYSVENKFLDLFKELMAEQWIITKKEKILRSYSTICGSLIINFSSLLLFFISAMMIWKNEFSLGNLISFLTYISCLNREVEQILNLNMESQKVQVCIKRLKDIESLPSEIDLIDNMETIKAANEKMLFVDNVYFSYVKENYVLNGFSLEINKNGLYIMVGKNGSGKSTFLKLLVRYYEYTSGHIWIGHKNLMNISIPVLRKSIKYIPKEPYIINASFLDNIRFFCDIDSDEEIYKGYGAVGLSEYIESLQEKYNTVLGENGITLSSGQKQKISIARAILSRANILLLDEITSDLDGKSERDINLILKKESKNRIIIHATHRIASAKEGTEIFVVDNGKMVISGRHEFLLANSEDYQHLFKYTR